MFLKSIKYPFGYGAFPLVVCFEIRTISTFRAETRKFIFPLFKMVRCKAKEGVLALNLCAHMVCGLGLVTYYYVVNGSQLTEKQDWMHVKQMMTQFLQLAINSWLILQ